MKKATKYMKKIEKNELLLVVGNWTSYIGNMIFDYANSVAIVRGSGKNVLLLAIYQSSETIINIIFNIIGGVVADGNNKKKIVIITDLLSAIVCFVLSFFLQTKFTAIVIVIANILLGIIYSFNSPTYKSIIREVIKKEHIGVFNSISNGGTEIIRIVGPVIALFIVNVFGVQGAMLFNAGTFLISAICEAYLVNIQVCAVKEKENTSFFQDLIKGFSYLCKEKKTLFLVVISAFVNFFLAGYNLLIPYTDKMYESVFVGFYSKVLIAEAMGGIIGSFICTKVNSKKIEESTSVMLLALGLTGVFLMFIPMGAMTNNILCCLLPFLLFGITLTIYNISFTSYVQVQVEADYLGRVFSIIFTVAVLFMPVGSFVFSAWSQVDKITSFIPVGFGIVLLAVIAWGVLMYLKRIN